MTNLFADSWKDVDSHELRLLLDKRIGGPGQYDSRGSQNRLCLPLAGSAAKIVIGFKDKRLVSIEPGPAFDAVEWAKVQEEVQTSILAGPTKIGREYSFSSFRVEGFWMGKVSGVQILPPPENAPRPKVEIAQHPFILEFPIKVSDLWTITNHRRMREHRDLTLLLNVLLAGRTSLQPRRSDHFWANVTNALGQSEIKWVQQFYFVKLGKAVIDSVSEPSAPQIQDVEPQEYYANVGHDGKPLRVPADLDQSICLYQRLSRTNRAKFNRATFWLDLASRLWTVSVSSSFACLISAVESLTDRGTIHRLYCEKCKNVCQHEVPGATERFRAFFERCAPGAALRKRRNEMYSLRSGILHGGELMQIDQDLDFGWDPPGWNELELHRELWGLTRIAFRNWLRDPTSEQKRVENLSLWSRNKSLILLGGIAVMVGGVATILLGKSRRSPRDE